MEMEIRTESIIGYTDYLRACKAKESDIAAALAGMRPCDMDEDERYFALMRLQKVPHPPSVEVTQSMF